MSLGLFQFSIGRSCTSKSFNLVLSTENTERRKDKEIGYKAGRGEEEGTGGIKRNKFYFLRVCQTERNDGVGQLLKKKTASVQLLQLYRFAASIDQRIGALHHARGETAALQTRLSLSLKPTARTGQRCSNNIQQHALCERGYSSPTQYKGLARCVLLKG